MPTLVRALAAASIALISAGCEEQRPTPSAPVQTVEVPSAVGETASTCALRAIAYTHGKLKDKFLIGKDDTDPLKRQALFAKRRLQVNTDGAENSYHSDRINADDRSVGAVNILCNANVKLYPQTWWSFLRRPEPVKCYKSDGVSVEPRYIEIYKAINSAGWKPAEGYRIEFNWNILAKRESDSVWLLRMFEPDRPCVNPSGFFVSKTKLAHYAPKDQCDQRAYLDSNEEKAIVLPQHWFADWASQGADRWASFLPGDVVVAHRAAEGSQPEAWVFGIVGDSGPLQKFGEATMAFNWQLQRKSGSIREKIRTYKEALMLDTDMLKPQEIPLLVLERTAPALGGNYSPDNVEKKAKEEFARWGGEARFKACLEVIKEGGNGRPQ
jgi:hypothetical protein